eukprot:Platyproteum_vivax@DN13928_c0_g1_i1.p1
MGSLQIDVAAPESIKLSSPSLLLGTHQTIIRRCYPVPSVCLVFYSADSSCPSWSFLNKVRYGQLYLHGLVNAAFNIESIWGSIFQQLRNHVSNSTNMGCSSSHNPYQQY